MGLKLVLGNDFSRIKRLVDPAVFGCRVDDGLNLAGLQRRSGDDARHGGGPLPVNPRKTYEEVDGLGLVSVGVGRCACDNALKLCDSVLVLVDEWSTCEPGGLEKAIADRTEDRREYPSLSRLNSIGNKR